MNTDITYTLSADDIAAMVAENDRRLAAAVDGYDPVRGIGAHGDRVEVDTPVEGLPRARVPRAMLDDPKYAVATTSLTWRQLRCRYDFEYWCALCVRIKPKDGYRLAPLVLNRGQRKVLAVLEADRLASRPIRVIVLKARQWGCSTLVQSYMAWIQMCIRPNWSSLICCHNKDSAVNIRRLYTDLIRDYPADMWDGGEDGAAKLQFRPFEGSTNVREITGRGCRVAVTSSESQDAIRGYDIAMAHLSETAYWRETPTLSPNDLIRSVSGSVALIPYSLIVMESTANGMGNYFYEEWQRAKNGESDKRPVFVAWFEIGYNSLPLSVDPAEFVASMSARELSLWNRGCTLQQINWYREKARSDKDLKKLFAEYPSDDVEAFASTDAGVFDQADVDRLMSCCREPDRVCKVLGGRFVDCVDGELQIWQTPRPRADYVVAVDIGGRSDSSDWSVIAVMRRCDSLAGGAHEIVAQWRGHVDHDILVDIACVIASRYNEALLVIESNTFETEANAGAGANGYVLRRLAESYSHLYRRHSVGEPLSAARIGFHTNRATKVLLVNGLIRALREHEYIERSVDACYELSVYTRNPDGSYSARKGCHDDILMTRALALQAIAELPPPSAVPPLATLAARW